MMKLNEETSNIHRETVHGFGDEWLRFPQDQLGPEIREQIFSDYFSLFDWDALPADSVVADIGCGSGRWAQVVAPRVGHLVLIDASPEAIKVAKSNLQGVPNVTFLNASVGSLPIQDASLDFAYSLGVLHHVPDTAAAIASVAAKLKRGAPFLLYLYYAFDNRGRAYRALWRVSDGIRRVVSRLPYSLRYLVSQVFAVLVYWPLARTALLLERLGRLPAGWPLAYYRDKSFYVLRTDALDRFGTRLEQRFTQEQIRSMLATAGFDNIRFSDHAPYWCAIGIKV
jgi:SAM-dependent methyltransferase